MSDREVDIEKDPHTVSRDVREQVLERDNGCCRVCGRWVESPALHHIVYRSQGGPNTVDNLVTVGWAPWHDCHLPVVHANKRLWQPILQVVVAHPGVTALQVRRWGLSVEPLVGGGTVGELGHGGEQDDGFFHQR